VGELVDAAVDLGGWNGMVCEGKACVVAVPLHSYLNKNIGKEGRSERRVAMGEMMKGFTMNEEEVKQFQ
jgi:hypothetical protein